MFGGPREGGLSMSENLRLLGKYSAAMESGDGEAVFEFGAPELTFTVELLIESDDLVVSNWTVRGTHTGTAFFDVPPSGKPVTINGTAILRIRDGQIVEHWGGPHCQEGLGLIRV